MKHKIFASALLIPSLCALMIIPPASAKDGPDSARLIREKINKGMSVRAKELERARQMGLPIRGEMPGGGLFELKTLSTKVPTCFITHNEAAARSTRADSVHAVFGGGPGVTLGVWDGGAARVTHREMTGRATWMDRYSYNTHPHSTHVGGTMIAAGVDPLAKGMSYEADLISYEWSFDDLEAEMEAQYGLTLSNHSYGHGRGWVVTTGSVYWYGDVEVSETEDYLFGFYSEVASDWDRVADENPGYLPVTSAGNDRNDEVPPGTTHYYWDGGWVSSTAVRDNDGGELGYDCIPDGLSTAKNTLVIGAVIDVEDYQGPESVEMATFSSWGPTDDGRIKPDICGNGYMLYSAVDGSDDAYGIYSGTSMASPNVCGSLGLLQAKHFEMHGRYMLGATVKALAITTAREAGPHPGPDYGFGWGLLDTWAAYEILELDPDGRKGSIVEIKLNDGRPLEFYYIPEEGTERLTFTIAWADPPAEVPSPALNDRTPVLVDDIDLRVTGAGKEYLPWVLDPDDPQAAAAKGDNIRDNVEQVVIEDPAPGTYLVKIGHKGSLRDGAQYVSMVVTGAVRTRTWHVYADGSGDVPTIKEAVELARPGDQILVFSDLQTGGTYNERDITLDKPLLIRGVTRPDRPRLTTGGEGRFFHIVQSEGAAPVVTVDIDGFHFIDCYAEGDVSDGRGGAISCEGARANLTSCMFEDCGAARGGAVYCAGECVTMNSCVFEDCEADEGGAVYLRESRSVIEDCIFYDNAAESGGGIFMLRSDAVLEGSTMSMNRADKGGALFLETSSPDIGNCTLAYNFMGPGSGIYVSGGGRPRIASSIVAFGNGSNATGIHAKDISSRPQVICCDVYGNEGGDYGGSLMDMTGIQGNISEDPVFCEADTYREGELTIGDGSPCAPNRNDCLSLIGASGVGCHTLSKMRITSDGTGDLPTVSDAMLVAEEGDTIILSPGVFTGPGNRDISARGSQVVVTSEAGAEETVIDCSEGGGSYYGFYFGSGEDTATVLEGITVKGAGDGAVICDYNSSPLIRDCRFVESSDGGIIVEANCSPVFRRCMISGNSRSPNGGGAYIRNSSPLFEDCEFTGNSASDNGGAIAAGSSSHPVFRRCLITGNTAGTDSGGGIYSIMGEATVEDCVISGNRAEYGGGGIFSGTSSALNVTGTLIAGNSSGYMGGGMYSASDMTMSRCTVADNYTENYGAGVEVYQGANNHIDNSIIAFNRNAEGIFTITGDIDITCSDVYGNEGGNYGGATADMTGPLNISVDPLFCDTAGGDWYLNADSPVLTPPDPLCGDMMGALGVRCGDSADLLFSSVTFDTMAAGMGRTIHVAAVVRNGGPAGAGLFRIDYYHDRDDPPEWGVTGAWYEPVDTLSPGDSIAVAFDISSPVAGMWRSWLMIDTDERIPEYNTDNNTVGPYALVWTFPGGIAPDRSKLRVVSPNPFGNETEIIYDLDRSAAAELSIYDLTGRRLMFWDFPPAGPGRFVITWPGTTGDGRQLPSGVYFLRFRVDGVVEQSEKIVRIR